MAWLSYLLLSLNKILTFANLCLLYQVWGQNDAWGVKKGGVIKSLRNTGLDHRP